MKRLAMFIFVLLTLNVNAEHDLGVPKNETKAREVSDGGVRGVTLVEYTCECSGKFNCSEDISVTGSITSNPKKFTSVSEKEAKSSCKDYLFEQGDGLCKDFGDLVLKETYLCEKVEKPIPTPQAGDTKTTKAGFVFVKDTSNPKLGNAWRDQSGVIWGDLVRKHGKVWFATGGEAREYCASIGAEVPSSKDFFRLSRYLGADDCSWTVNRDYELASCWSRKFQSGPDAGLVPPEEGVLPNQDSGFQVADLDPKTALPAYVDFRYRNIRLRTNREYFDIDGGTTYPENPEQRLRCVQRP